MLRNQKFWKLGVKNFAKSGVKYFTSESVTLLLTETISLQQRTVGLQHRILRKPRSLLAVT